jgi:hypothetical protein
MNKRVAVPVASFLAVGVLISGCASSTEETTGQHGLQFGAPVPGEKIPGEDIAPPVAGGPSAGVRW